MRYESDHTKFWTHLTNRNPIKLTIQHFVTTWFFSGLPLPTLTTIENLNCGDRRGPEVPGAMAPIWYITPASLNRQKMAILFQNGRFFLCPIFCSIPTKTLSGLRDMKIGTFAHLFIKKSWNLAHWRPRYTLWHSKKKHDFGPFWGYKVLVGIEQNIRKTKSLQFWNKMVIFGTE